MHRLLTSTFAAALAGLVATSVALADSPRKPAPPPNGGSSSISQYVEVVPTSAGPTAPGTGRHHVSKLPTSVARSLTAKGGSDAAALKKIATDSNYGALRTVPRASRPEPQAPAAVAASEPIAGSSTGHRLEWLLVVLVLCAAGAAGAWWARGGRHPQHA